MPGSHGVRDGLALCFDPNFGTIGYVCSEERRRISIACSCSSNVSLKPRRRFLVAETSTAMVDDFQSCLAGCPTRL